MMAYFSTFSCVCAFFSELPSASPKDDIRGSALRRGHSDRVVEDKSKEALGAQRRIEASQLHGQVPKTPVTGQYFQPLRVM